MTALIKRGTFNLPTARFFAGEIAIALHSIHQQHFLHSDLKPDNILIAQNGHIKLTDFGLSTNYLKNDNERKRLLDEIQELMIEQCQISRDQYATFHERGKAIGTCGYTAPEILRGHEPTILSDYWSLGVILYEMLFGYPPFPGKSLQETALRILHWCRALRYPADKNVPAEAIDLLKHLLCEPENRYQFEQIAAHPFFAGFNFECVDANIPPMIPIIRFPTDTAHFDEIEPDGDEGFGALLPCEPDLAKFAFLGYTYKQKPRGLAMMPKIGGELF